MCVGKVACHCSVTSVWFYKAEGPRVARDIFFFFISFELFFDFIFGEEVKVGQDEGGTSSKRKEGFLPLQADPLCSFSVRP